MGASGPAKTGDTRKPRQAVARRADGKRNKSLPYNAVVAKSRLDKKHEKLKARNRYHRQKKHLLTASTSDNAFEDDDYVDRLVNPLGGDRARLNEDWECAPSLKKRKKPSGDGDGRGAAKLADSEQVVNQVPTAVSEHRKNRLSKTKKELHVPVPFKEDLKAFAKKKAAQEALRTAAEAEVAEKRKRTAEYSKERQKKARLLDKKNSKGQPVMSGLLQSILQKLQGDTSR
mmetsp:Transcript_39281/g.83061  ORF Transcript_39281/g.83061 Transcript_39281/m.83061 type:complete len:230 (-) Transcript_39281:15-704(-)